MAERDGASGAPARTWCPRLLGHEGCPSWSRGALTVRFFGQPVLPDLSCNLDVISLFAKFFGKWKSSFSH